MVWDDRGLTRGGGCRSGKAAGAALAWELKVEYGTFGQAELTAHKAAAEMLGKHRALHEVANMLYELIQKGK